MAIIRWDPFREMTQAQGQLNKPRDHGSAPVVLGELGG